MSLGVFTTALLLGVILSVFCRLEALDLARTRPLVLVQLGAALLASLAALLGPPQVAELALAVGLWVYLVAEAARWAGRQPLDTLRPLRAPRAGAPVPARHMRQVRGGLKPAPAPAPKEERTP